ncbi:MAG: PAS domain-containing protein, partial [Anaerolineales bacterium]|nr:PAS domain-containing protein [Anaerolineales bacterium]
MLASQIAVAVENARLFAESAQRLAILENSDDYIGMAAPDGKQLYINPAGVRMLGYDSLEEMLSLPGEALLSPDDLQRYTENLDHIYTEGSWRGEMQLMRKDGTPVMVEQSIFLIRDADGEVLAIATISTDITERKQAEAARARQDMLIRAIINATDDWIFLKDHEFRYLLVNPPFAEYYGGRQPEDMVGLDDYELGTPEYLIEGDPEQGIVGIRNDDREVLSTGQAVHNPHDVINFADGSIHILDTKKMPLHGPDGNIIGVLGMARDMTQVERARRRQQLAYELGQRLNTLLDPDELLDEVVTRMSEAFGFYHAHIYLYDEAGQKLVVQAGLGEAGATMKERQHSIALNLPQSLVARAARTFEPVVVNDVSLDPNHLPNPLLPETRSEVALPLVMGQRLIGVMDIQHNLAEFFTEDEIQVLSLLSSQISVALSNAHSFDATQAALAQTEMLYRASERLNEATSAQELLAAVLETVNISDANRAGVNVFER